MGKKQHQKDKMYLTSTEWATLYGGKRPTSGSGDQFRRLPFDHCALSLQPFEEPYCDGNGNIFDLLPLLPFLRRFKCNPVTGEKLEAKSLTKLKFHKDGEGKPQCPVMMKQYTPKSHIVAIRTTGNVFCYEAVEELNIKTKNWKELLTDEPFVRSDIITIQDPNNLEKFNLSNFHHLKRHLRIENEELERAKHDPSARIKSKTLGTKEMMEELERDYVQPQTKQIVKEKANPINAAHFSTGMVAASFTSTVMPVITVHEAAIREEDSVRYERVKKKGYVRVSTSCGPINFELHCDITPKACENFLLLCRRGYYNGTLFHRSIKHFMIQGGDPSGKGSGGESAWGKPFGDEIRPNLHHEGRGVLCMANSGPATNSSQFFITYRSCKHLDGKHTVFGKVVGGMDTLSAMEKIQVDNKDRPIEDIVFLRAEIFGDPYEEVDRILGEERSQLAQEAEEERQRLSGKLTTKVKVSGGKDGNKDLKVYKEGVGKYINPKRKLENQSVSNGSSTLSIEPGPSSSSGATKKNKTDKFEFDFGKW